jgi:hypothetical protein
MYPLIEITSVPIEIRMKTTNASLEYTRGTAEMEISRSDKGIDIKSRPIKLKLDTFEPRSAAAASGAMTTRGVVQPQQVMQTAQTPQGDRQAAYEATSAYSDQGQIMLNARFGQELLNQSMQQEPLPEPVRQAETAVETEDAQQAEWEDGQMEIRYEMDKLNFDWKIDKGEFEFTPGDIELIVEQQPKVIIKYKGGPIYVPRSADPNYEPVDVKA